MTTENKEYTSDEQQDANIVEDNARFIAKKLFGERKGHSRTAREIFDWNGDIRRQSNPLNLEPVESGVFIFDTEETVAALADNTDEKKTLFLYTVIDARTYLRETFPASKELSEIIDTHLKQGTIILRIYKIGKKEPRYAVCPVRRELD